MHPTTERAAQLIDAAVTAGGLGPRYTQEHRAYHDLMHIEDVLLRLEELHPPPEHELALVLAAWFHDAVYQPGKHDNEERSAHVAADALEQAGASPELIAEVMRLVRVTDRHQPDDGDEAGAILCDADLAILASTPERYAEYVAGVRKEYAHVPEDDFRRGRAEVLRHYLDSPRIFHTAYGHAEWEDRARANLVAEIERLESTDE